MAQIRPAAERGHSQLSWLNSYHSFSFGDYYDPRFQGFSHLRVINEDSVMAGAGFASHGHRDMEIISYVRQGTLVHQDSLGTRETIQAGEFQLMRAGSGIRHSEFNASASEAVHFLQIWIAPAQRGLAPGYQQRAFATQTGLQVIATPDGADGSLQIAQNMTLFRWQGGPLDYVLAPGRWLYLQLLTGQLNGAGIHLATGDGLQVREPGTLNLQGQGEALLFDLPAA